MTLEQLKKNYKNIFDYTILVNDKKELLLAKNSLKKDIKEYNDKLKELEKNKFHSSEMITFRDNLIYELEFVVAVLEIAENGEDNTVAFIGEKKQ